MTTRLRIATSGSPAFAADIASGAAVGKFVKCVAGPTPASPLDVEFGDPALNVNLSNVVFVDSETTVPLAQQTGNIEAPYSSLQQAVTARAPFAGADVQTICLVRNATGYGDCTFPAGTMYHVQAFDFVPLGAALYLQPPAGNRTIVCGVFTLNGGAGFEHYFRGLSIDHFVHVATTGADVAYLQDCVVSASTVAAAANPLYRLWGTIVLAGFAASALSCAECTFSAGPINLDGPASQVELSQTTLAGTVFASGGPIQFVCDAASASDLQYSLTNLAGAAPALSTIEVPYPRKVDVTVAVPLIAAGNVDYVDVPIVAAGFPFMLQDQPLGWNPGDDFAPAGAGGGLLNVRSAFGGVLRFTLLGPLAAGNHHVFVWLA